MYFVLLCYIALVGESVYAQNSSVFANTMNNTSVESTDEIRPRIMIVPIMRKGVEVASGILIQKLHYYYFNQSNGLFRNKFIPEFILKTPNDSDKIITTEKTIQYWIKVGNNIVMVVNLQIANTKNSKKTTDTSPLFTGRITISHESEPEYILDMKLPVLSLREILLLSNKTLAGTIYNSTEDSQKMLESLELTHTLPFALRVADLYLQANNIDKIEDTYVVEVDNERLDMINPERIKINTGERFIKLIQIDKEGNETVVGTSFIHTQREEYKTQFLLLDEEEKKKQKKIPSVISSWLITDILFGYFYQFLSDDDSNIGLKGGALTGLIRLTILPATTTPVLSFLRIGADLSFFMKQSTFEDSMVLQSASPTAFVGGTYTFFDKAEVSGTLGGGVTFITQSGTSKIIASTKTITNIVPHFTFGANVAYNIPMFNFGYLRVLLDATITNPVITIAHNNKRSTQIPQWIGITAGIGWRY